MKNLKEILVEKLRVDDIVLGEKFPIDGKIEDIIKFLKKQGFEDIDDSAIIFDSAKSKCYTTYKNTHIWFTDTSKEKNSKKNPIFHISVAENIATPEKIFEVYYYSSNVDIIDIVDNDKDEFLEELNKRFGWQ